MNRDASVMAAQKEMRPYVFFGEEDVGDKPLDCLPSLGNHRPAGWSMREDTMLCDSSGWGKSKELAFTSEETSNAIRHIMQDTPGTVGFAVIETGQFQVTVGIFDKVEESQRAPSEEYMPEAMKAGTELAKPPATSHGVR
jgi:hypothetical protein